MNKICCHCDEVKPTSEFRRDRTQKDGFTHRCKVCIKHYHKNFWTTNADGKAKAIERSRIIRDRTKQKLSEYKDTLECAMCNESENCCLDFHHTDGDKSFGIGNSISRKWEVVLEEIQKCIVLCANCHRKLHAGVLTIPQEKMEITDSGPGCTNK